MARHVERKRILLVTNIFPPHIGGPASFIDRLAHALARREHRVTVVCSSDRQTDETDRERPFRVRRVCLANRELYEVKVRWVLFWEMFRHRIVLVNGLESYAAQVAGILRRTYVLKVVGDSAWETARNRGTTLVDIDEFQTSAEEQAVHKVLVARRNRSLRFARRIFTPSDYLRRMVTGWGFPPEHVVTIQNGVEVDANAGPSRTLTSSRMHVVFVGRLTNWKGVETLLLALTGWNGVTATIVGDGPEYPHLFELSKQLGVADRARFVGRKTPDEVKKLISEADTLVLVSLYEGMSHTLLEAAALGCPCIASDIGGNRELIVSGVNGILVPPHDVQALRQALERFLRDPALRLRLGEQARETALAHRLERTVDGVIDLLNTAF